MGTRATKKASALSLEINHDGIAIVTMDVPGEAQNTLKMEFNDEFEAIFSRIEQSDSVRGVVIRSGKKGSFIAGADITMIEKVRSAPEATELSKGGQRGFDRLEKSPIPVVAAIDGACLGGGLELALACHARIASSERQTVLGLPEVQLGLLPGAGGTQRLPRRVGIATALDMMLTGKQLKAKRALKMGLVDDVVPASILTQVAIEKALELADAPKLPAPRGAAAIKAKLTDVDLQKLALEQNAVGRTFLFKEARKKLLSKSHGNYPAAERIIDAAEIGYRDGIQKGYDAEAQFFGELVLSSVSTELRRIFFNMTTLKKENGVDDATVRPVPLTRVGVLGAGLMGAGIAFTTVEKANVDVRIKDRDGEGLARGAKQLSSLWGSRVKKRAMTPREMDRAMARVTSSTTWAGFEKCEVLIEAVFEDIGLKQRMVREFEAVAPATAIFASNTSSIPITTIAQASKRPETVIGMHYFSPVEKMPLLEIITTDKTAPWVTATCVELGKKQGKTVIVVRDGVGFYTSRILAPYMNEAAYILDEGVAIEAVDQALERWGFPVGPMTLLDEVGIDVAAKVGPIMVDAFGARMVPPGAADQLVKMGRLGRKNGKGLYKYGDKKKKGKKEVDETVYDDFGRHPSKTMDPVEIAERCALQMVNEAVLCLQEGILRSPRDGDMGAIFGLGFPPFRGGPFRYSDSVGAAEVLAKLQRLRDQHGIRFEPAQLLADMAKSGKRFY